MGKKQKKNGGQEGTSKKTQMQKNNKERLIEILCIPCIKQRQPNRDPLTLLSFLLLYIWLSFF
jgi:hypothetical protein